MNSSPLLRSAWFTLAAVALAFGPAHVGQAVDFPAPSPASTLKQRVGLTDIEITYSRPGVKGRKIFGGLEPYGKVWRTGANAATTISFSTPVKFAGKEVPAGTYALYTIPDPQEWTVILSKKTDNWGAFGYSEADDLLRVNIKPEPLATPLETFTISIDDIRDESAVLTLSWENTRLAVPLTVNYARQLVAEIEQTMAGDSERKPYHQAAQYFYDHDQDLTKARGWIEQAVADNPAAYWSLHLKAKILARLGDKAGAIAAAKKSIELASKNGDTSYVKSNNDLLETLN
jgi:hypothetical protein